MKHRRELLKILGAAPIAADMVKTHAAELLASPALTAAMAVAEVGEAISAPGLSRKDKDPVRALLEKQIHKSMNASDRLNRVTRAARTGNYDADIMALKSVSAVNKQRLQVERDYTEDDIMSRARNFLYGMESDDNEW